MSRPTTRNAAAAPADDWAAPIAPRLTATASSSPGSRRRNSGESARPLGSLWREQSWPDRGDEDDLEEKRPEIELPEPPSPTPDAVHEAVWARSSSDSEDSDKDWRPVAAKAPAGRVFAATTKKFNRSNSRRGRSLMQNFFSSLSKNGKSRVLVPQTQQEADRNIIQYQIIFDLFDDRHHLAPTVRPRTVLDLGTGPGTWAMEYAKAHPNSQVLGADVEAAQPYTSPSNCHFHSMDISAQDWDLGHKKFDFIHGRMLGDLPDKKQLIRTIRDHLNPGGWVEFTEWIRLVQSPDHSLDGTAFRRWNTLIRKGLAATGHNMEYPLQYKPLLEELGFESVVVTKLAAPTNACYPGKKAQRLGKMMTANWNAILDPVSIQVLQHGMGWTEADVRALVKDVRRELVDTKYHSFITLLTVYARKPRRSGSMTSGSNSSFAASNLALAASETTATTEST